MFCLTMIALSFLKRKIIIFSANAHTHIHTLKLFSFVFFCFFTAPSNGFLLTFFINVVHGYGTECLHSCTGFFNFRMNPIIGKHSFSDMSFLLCLWWQYRIYITQNELIFYWQLWPCGATSAIQLDCNG